MQKITLTRDYPDNIFSVINDPVTLQTNPKILVLIPSKDRNDLLFQCIESIFTCTSKKLTNITICIIDTGSSDETIADIQHVMSNSPKRIKVQLLKHGYYNFAKNNNQAFKECKGSKFDYVLFCNNDIKLLNDCIGHLVKTFETEKNPGTVGARLHFGDGTVQHLGVSCTVDHGKALPGHYGFGKKFTGSILTGNQNLTGNTAAFMMMEADLFSKIMFSEAYIGCFEDVQLNLNVGMLGRTNYCNLDATAFHYESQSRNEDAEKLAKQQKDLRILSSFISNNSNNSFIKSYVFEQ